MRKTPVLIACGSGGIAAKRVDESVAPTFANLYVPQARQGQRLGPAFPRDLHRGDRSTPDNGAG